MNQIEKNHVFDVYYNIAEHFSSTRYSHWICVKKYLTQIQDMSYLIKQYNPQKINFLDFGCGNGKYLSFGKDFNSYALDNCDELLNIVKKTYPDINIIKADVATDNFANFNLQNNFFDSIISVAVIHHLFNEFRRVQMLKNIILMLKPGGTFLITAWATTILNKSKSKSNSNSNSKYTKLDTPNDYLIPWNNKFQRYYHLFEPNELEELIEKTGLDNQIQVIDKIFESDNWIMIFKKKIFNFNNN